MLDFDRIIGFDWDAGNVRKNSEKHDVSQTETEQVFFNDPLLIATDDRHSRDEQTFNALGMTDTGRYLHITFTLRESGSKIRVVSARPMSRKERLRYDEEA
jgi:uncharacterized DUF497 family protein